MASLTAAQLVVKALGKQELTPAEDALVPEFERFLRGNPNDVNFVLERTAGSAYGQLVCMEDSCFSEILLEPHPALPDGGIARGFGSLLKYEEHIKASAEHRAARDARVANEAIIKAEKPPEPLRKSGSSSSSKKTSSTSKGFGASGGFGASSPAAGSYSSAKDKKPLIEDDFGPIASGSGTKGKKRTSDLGPHSSAGDVYEDDVVDKKPKLDAAEPRVLADRLNAGPAAGPASGKTPAQEYKEIKDKLDRWREIADEINRMPPVRRTTSDYEDLDAANREIAVLQAKETSWRSRNGVPPGEAARAAAAPAVPAVPGIAHPAQIPGAFPNYTAQAAARLAAVNANAQAGPSNGAAPGGLGYDPIGRAMLAASQPGAGALPANGDSDDDEAELWRQVAPVSTEDFDNFFKRAVEGESFEGNANVDNAAAVIGLKSQTDKLPHMTVSLLPHQIIGVAWMKQQEAGSEYGGILGDEMGLGKTIEAIAACLVTESKDPGEKSTLVVAPVALLEQWRQELEEKVEPGYFSVAIYHGPERHKMTKKKLMKYDFVLTTYQTLTGEYPDEEGAMKRAIKAAKKDGGDPEDYLEIPKRGPLLEIGWFRIILDEAQNIRNRNTQISKACCELDSIYRWALTGTPVTNSLADLYPLFRFLQLKPWYEWSHFRERITAFEKRAPNQAGKRAQAVLRTCMLRRKKDSKLDGKQLIELKKKDVHLHEIEFSEEEREIYTMIETKAQNKFNKFLKQGTVMKNYANVLVMILRLRQVCFHPSLVADAEQTAAQAELDKEALLGEVERAEKQVGRDFVRKVKERLLNETLDRMRAEKAGGEVAEPECPVCLENPEQDENGAVVTRCAHIFCRTCAEEIVAAPPKEDHDDQGAGKKCKADQRPCPLCRSPVGLNELYKLSAFEPSDFELTTASGGDVEMADDDDDDTLGGFIVNDEDEDDSGLSRKDKGKGKAPKQPNRRVIQDSDDEHSEAEEVPEPSSSKAKGKGKKAEKTALELDFMQNQELSAKMLWAESKVNEILAEEGDQKIIIISSFTSALDLMETYLNSKGHRTTRYQGDMNRAARDEALRVLKKSKKCKIMLLSLKAGGVGLTLTRANRVIALDLAWSPAVEAQAFDRVHRIGQTRDVQVDRLTITNSVEQRILELQNRKQGLSDAAFGEGKAQKLGKLTVADLAGLFGLNGRGELI
ncbi:hypothetical protein JCM10213_008780 [Rhodosporidiobolus nylandii]